MDFVSKEKRSAIMRGVKGKDTAPEKRVRSALHFLGFRFRIHRKDLPGKPDICLPKYRTVLFVHGCFWHQHKECKEGRVPASNTDFWKRKFTSTRKRDLAQAASLKEQGWRVITIWECETADPARLNRLLHRALKRPPVKVRTKASGKLAR